jgi:hypothetical protein
VATADQTAPSTARAPGAAAGRARLLARGALMLTAALQGEIGVWGLIAPHSFFTTYPGLGHHWVSALGRYDEHLLRDYAGAELGFAVLLAAGAVWFERRLVIVAGAAFLAATLPHFAYHLTTTDHLSTADNLGSLGGFAIELVLVSSTALLAWRAPE